MFVAARSEVRLPTNPKGQLKGFAYIEFADKDAAQKAVAKNGQELDGRQLKIEIAKPRSSAPRDQAPSDKPEGCTTVFVGNLSWAATEDDLRNAFSDCGEITSVRIAWDHENDRSKG